MTLSPKSSADPVGAAMTRDEQERLLARIGHWRVLAGAMPDSDKCTVAVPRNELLALCAAAETGALMRSEADDLRLLKRIEHETQKECSRWKADAHHLRCLLAECIGAPISDKETDPLKRRCQDALNARYVDPHIERWIKWAEQFEDASPPSTSPVQAITEALEEDDDPRSLKSCPFCGGVAERLDFEDDVSDPNFGGSCICCKQCGANGPVHFDRKENLYSSWNDRVRPAPSDDAQTVEDIEIDYTNYRGERGVRTVVPTRVWWGSTQWHPQEQWFLKAYDPAKKDYRDFALKDIRSFGNSSDNAEQWRYQIPGQYRYLKYEPKTVADDGWNARVLGAERNRNPHGPTSLVRTDWFAGFDECGAFLSQEIG